MTDQPLVVSALREVGRIIAEHLELGYASVGPGTSPLSVRLNCLCTPFAWQYVAAAPLLPFRMINRDTVANVPMRPCEGRE
jgi:hypothetical protein